MKEVFLSSAKYLQEKDKKIYGILDKLSNDDREKERGSYYHSLSNLYRHCSGCIGFFVGIMQEGLSAGSAAKKIGVYKSELAEGDLTEDQWHSLRDWSGAMSKALTDFVNALTEEELLSPVTPPWMQSSIPLWFALNMLLVHSVHHQGAIAQILDEMKIENDFSSIDPKVL